MYSGVNLLLWDTVKVTQFVLIVHVGMTQVVQNASLEIRRVFCGRHFQLWKVTTDDV